MRFDRRYGNEIDPDQSLLELLAARYDLSEQRARDVLERARRDAAGDEYRRPVETWVAILMREARVPAPGKRTRVMGGRRSMVGAGESADVVPGRWTRTHAEAIRLEERRVFLAKMRAAYGPQVDGVEIHEGSREVPAGRKALARGGQIHVESGLDLDGAHGEQVIAHELAHVAQQTWRGGGWDDGPPSRGALEADAHGAAEQAIAGRTADVRLAAPATMALGYSEGEDKAPAKARGGQPAGGGGGGGGGGAPAAKASTPRGAAPAPRAAAPAPASAESPRGARGTETPAAAGGGDGKRGRGADGVLLPEAATGLSAPNQQRLGQVDARNQSAGAMTTALPSAQHSTDGARAAVEEPTAEQDARAQHGVVTEVDKRPPPSPEIEAACTRIREVIKNKRPPSEDKLVEARPREMAAEAGAQMDAGVESRTDGVRQEYADVQESPKGQPSREPVPVELPPSKVETPAVDAGAGAPEPSAPEETSLDDDVAAQEQKLDDAGMNTEPAKLVQDGPIGDARGGVGELKGMARTDPAKVRLEQGKAIAKAQADMRNLQAAADKALADARAGTVTGVGAQSKEIKGSEEQQRARAGQEMQAIFQRTQKTVDGLLTPLARTALAKWQAGVDRLSTEFEGRLAHVKAKIEERYKSEDNGNPLDELGAMWNKGTDAVFGLPDWVVAAYDAAEGAFASGCMDLLRDVSRDVNDVIETCKQLIQQARKDIDAIVEKLPASLQSWARGEADRLGKQLDKLDQKVADTQKNINKDLVQRAFGAVQDVRQRVHELREAAKGLIGKIADAVGAFLANPAKAIVDGLLRVLGIAPESFWAMVGRLGDVIGAIAKEPLRFANTLIQGVAQGFGRFFDKFPQHIGESIFGWIFGTLGAAGVSMPSDFSGPGILASMLGMFGIDGGLVTSMVGEGLSPDEMAEAQGELGAVSGGPMAIVELLREHLDPGAMMAMIKQAAIEFLLTAIITRVAMRIVMLFNPAGAILQAIEAILRVMVWVVTNAARIFTLIETLVAGAGQIIAGNVAGAAALVESALVQIIVPVIDFLAGYLGLGGLPGKIREIIMKLRGKVEAALKKVTGAISGRARAKAKAKREQEKKKPAAKEPAKEAPRDGDKDRDPDRRDDDEENDPRKGKDRPDENDPRRANRRDDEGDDGPDRTRRKDDDDGPDGKRRKDGDDDDGPNRKRRKDDDDDGNDLAAARRAARQAADRGWAAARTASARELLARGELEAVLRRADQPIGRAKIDLDVEERGRVWAVEADARVGTARARDSEGSGWIARNEAGGSFYAADDHSAFNRQLIDEAFAALKRGDGDDDAVTLRGAYDEKTEDGKRVEREQQAKLDQRIRGVRFELTLEAFAGAEKDEKIETKARVTPNMSETTTQVDIRDKFPFVVGDARPGLGSRMLDAVKQQVAPFKPIPMLEGERAVPGYVVNIAATGSEAKKSPGMAVRYFGDAWAGSDRAAEATNRTAVVIGVNGYQHVDPDLTTKSEGDIEAAVRAVSTDHKNANITIFGWMWDLPWERVGGGAVDHDTVRAAFLKLKTEEERKAVRAVNEAWKTDGTVQWTLPYGEFRNKVTDSSYTSDAVHRLGAVADPVHILLQDGDGGVKAAGADGAGLRGVFTEYDEFLSRLSQHRLLTIGGYRFTGFDWDAEPDATPKTRQLTELGNAIDHAIRSAIATVYPEMLYPTEPNLLIKALDEQHEDGIMNVRPGAEGGRMVPPGMFEHRAVEGWRAGHTVRNAQPDHPHKVAWAPQAALTTSPVPDKPSRGLTVYDYDASEEVNAGGDGVATMANQAQTYLNPETMALWYGRSIGNGKMNVSADMKAMFQQVTAAASTRLGEMGAPADPNADYHAGLSQAHAQATANARRASRQQPRQQREAWLRQRQERLDQIHRIVHAIITTLVSGDLDTIWHELKKTFDGFLENPVPRPVADDAEADDAAADASPAAGPAPENGA
jgi:hypothetical protein